jgi:hypothetical protein
MRSRAKEAQMKVVIVYESMFGNTKTIGGRGRGGAVRGRRRPVRQRGRALAG